jgi:sigma-B regulation protein RsbU (phosphoserine phosphatase)
VIGHDGVRKLDAGGPVIGLLEGAPFDQGIERLMPGDVVVIVSDGVSEAFNAAGDEFGEARVLDVALRAPGTAAQALVEQIVSAVRGFTKGALQSDDITVMVIRYLGGST